MRRAVAALALALVLGPLEPAHAEDDDVLLSLDGERWSTEIDRPLFDGEHRWVPGDESEVRFWVRNDSGRGARLQVTVVDADGSLRLGRDVELATWVDGIVRRPAAGRLLVDRPVDDEPVRVDVTARMPVAAGNDSQRRSTALRFRVTLVGVPEPAGGDAAAPGEGTTADRLPATGAPVRAMTTSLLGLIIAAVGLAFIGRSGDDHD